METQRKESPEMESVHANISPYVSTTSRKMAETPAAEGECSPDAYKTYGPFHCDGVNKKALLTKEDPVEKAIDSILLFFDDVREASETQRCEAITMSCGGAGLNGTLEKFTEGICKNPCMEDCSRIQPPADLMLKVEQAKSNESSTLETVLEENESREESEETEETPKKQRKPQQPQHQQQKALRDYSLSKENSVRDFNVSNEEPASKAPKKKEAATKSVSATSTTTITNTEEQEEQEEQDTIQLFKDTMISVVPEEYQEQLKEHLDYYLPDERVLGIDVPVDLPKGEYPVDEDPIVEAIDRLILMFDELKESMVIHKAELLKSMEEHKTELLKKAAEFGMKEKTALIKYTSANSVTTKSVASEETIKTVNKKKEKAPKKKEEAPKKKEEAPKKKEEQSPKKKEEAPKKKEEVPKKKKKPLPSSNMAPEELSEAVKAAATVLAETAPEEDRNKYTPEELHERALERIMSERSEYEEDIANAESGEYEYKTEDEILAELLREADEIIMNARSAEETKTNTATISADKSKKKYMMAPPSKCPTDELTTLETSFTLTPIPEADEEQSNGTPSMSEKLDKLESALKNGSVPSIPMPSSKKKSEKTPSSPVKGKPKANTEQQQNEASRAPKESDAEERDSPEDMIEETRNQSPEEETDPIIRAIDDMFLYYDDVKEQDYLQKGCAACIGGEPTNSDVMELKEMLSEESIKSLHEPCSFERLSEEEKQEAKQEQKQASKAPKEEKKETTAATAGNTSATPTTASVGKDYTSPIDLTTQPTADPVVNAIDDLMQAFDVAKEQEESIKSFSEKLNKLKECILKGSSEKEYQLLAVKKAEELRSQLEMKESQVSSPVASSSSSTRLRGKVEFEFPESLRQEQDPYISWGGDDSELMASINADRKLSELEHENIFRDVSKGLDASAGGIITRAGNKERFSIYNAPAFTEGNSSSRSNSNSNEEERVEKPAEVGVKVLSTDRLAPHQSIVSSDKVKAINKQFQGWSLSKKREQMLKAQLETAISL